MCRLWNYILFWFVNLIDGKNWAVFNDYSLDVAGKKTNYLVTSSLHVQHIRIIILLYEPWCSSSYRSMQYIACFIIHEGKHHSTRLQDLRIFVICVVSDDGFVERRFSKVYEKNGNLFWWVYIVDNGDWWL